MPSSTRLLLAALALPLLAACGDEFFDDQVVVDPGYFLGQRFSCNPDSGLPSCPPFACSVDGSGRVYDCDDDRCGFSNTTTAFEFQGPPGVFLCVPSTCTVEAENTAPVCEPDCSDDGTTIYVFKYACR